MPRGAAVQTPRVRRENSTQGTARTTVTHTADGDLVERWAVDPATESWHPVEFPVKTRDDLRRFRWLCDTKVTPDPAAAAESRRQAEQIGKRGIAVTSWGTSPLMNMVEHAIGPAETAYFLADYDREMDELIALFGVIAMLACSAALSQPLPDDKLPAFAVPRMSDTCGDGTGFDVLSFDDRDDSEWYVEVKTTGLGKFFPFCVTANEVRCSEACSKKYRLYRVFQLSRSPRIYVLPGALSRTCRLEATEYRAVV